MPTNNDLLDLARRFREQIEAQDERALRRLISAYRLMYEKLEGKIDALLLQIEKDGITSAAQAAKLARYRELMRQIDEEVDKYAAFLRTEIEMSTRAAMQAGLRHSYQLSLELLKGHGISAQLQNLPVNAIRTLLGFLSDESPLWDRIKLLTGAQAQRVRDALINGMGLGKGPRETARMIRDAFGRGLTDALRMTRTADLWAYREAARANYAANSDIVSGWIWMSSRDADTCAACLAEDGEIHKLDEMLEGHYNCRCYAAPYIEGLTEPPIRGEQWFRDQSEQVQRGILGPGKYDAWKNGQFDFGDLSKRTPDETYGWMTVEKTLRELLGEDQ